MASACAVGPREGQGPLGDCFDLVAQDAAFGQDSYEQAEAAAAARSLPAVPSQGKHR